MGDALQQEEELNLPAVAWPPRHPHQAQEFLLRSGTTIIAFSAMGFVCTRGDDDHLGDMLLLHLFLFYVIGLAGACLLFLSSSAHKFPSAARRAASMAAAVVGLRRRLLRWVLTSGLSRRDRSSLSTFYSSVWCAAALFYIGSNCTLCYYGAVWCVAFFSI